MKWPGLKLGCWGSKGEARTAYEVAQDNIVASNPPPKEKDIVSAIRRAALALAELEQSVVRMMTGRGRTKR